MTMKDENFFQDWLKQLALDAGEQASKKWRLALRPVHTIIGQEAHDVVMELYSVRIKIGR